MTEIPPLIAECIAKHEAKIAEYELNIAHIKASIDVRLTDIQRRRDIIAAYRHAAELLAPVQLPETPLQAAEPAPAPAMAPDAVLAYIRELTELLRHLTGGDSRYEQERLRLVCNLRDELRRRTGAMHQGEVA